MHAISQCYADSLLVYDGRINGPDCFIEMVEYLEIIIWDLSKKDVSQYFYSPCSQNARCKPI